MRGAVLVTGGARRIGRAICRALAEDGWRVLVHARLAGDGDAQSLASELGGRAFFADLSEPLGPARLFNAVCAEEPAVSALVNNAAVFSTEAELPPDDAARMAAVNAAAPEKLTTMLAMRLMTNDERGPGLPSSGAVVNILDSRILPILHSAGGASAASGRTPYVRSKTALWEAQRRAAANFASVLRVNGVAPGPVLAPSAAHEKGGETLLGSRPTPEDVAQAVVFLLSAKATTGSVIPVDSGQSLLF